MENVNPFDYYKNLPRGTKSKFLLYLVTEYGMNYDTIRRKLYREELSKLEYLAIQKTIKEEVWNK